MKNLRQSRLIRNSWKNPKVRERRCVAIKKAMALIPKVRRVEIGRLGGSSFGRKLRENEEYAEKISTRFRKAQIKRYSDPEKSEAHRQACKRSHTKKWLANVRAANCGRTPEKNWLTSPEGRKWASERMKKLWSTKAGRRKLNNGEFLTKEQRERISQGAVRGLKKHASPTLPEKKLNALLQNYFPGIFSFNVKRCYRIGGKVADFVDKKEKIVVEMFGVFWHGEQRIGRTRRAESARRKAHFLKHGYQCVIVWQDELDDVKKIVKQVLRVLCSGD